MTNTRVFRNFINVYKPECYNTKINLTLTAVFVIVNNFLRNLCLYGKNTALLRLLIFSFIMERTLVAWIFGKSQDAKVNFAKKIWRLRIIVLSLQKISCTSAEHTIMQVTSLTKEEIEEL